MRNDKSMHRLTGSDGSESKADANIDLCSSLLDFVLVEAVGFRTQ